MLSSAGLLPDGDKGTVTSELPLADKAVNIGLYTRCLAQRPGTFTFVGSRWNPIYVSIALLDTMNTEGPGWPLEDAGSCDGVPTLTEYYNIKLPLCYLYINFGGTRKGAFNSSS